MSESRVVVITGASRGIGAATAVEYARRGDAVVLAARDAESLTEAAKACRSAGGEALTVPTDVTERDQVEGLIAAAVERFGRVDVLVNNAGFGVHARVHETTERDMRDIFEANFFGLFFGCRAVAPVMIGQRAGHIFNVSSVIGRRGTPFSGAYCATKFAVCGLTEAMRVEMAPYDVRVTLVCPGLTDTGFFDRVRGSSSAKRSSFVRLRGLMPPEKVARRIVKRTGKRTPEMVFSIGGRLLIFINNRWPRLGDRMMKAYHDDLVKSEPDIDLP